MKQPGSVSNLSYKKTPEREPFEQVEPVVPWSALVQAVKSYQTKGKTRSPAFGTMTMLRMNYTQQWFALTEPECERRCMIPYTKSEDPHCRDGAIRVDAQRSMHGRQVQRIAATRQRQCGLVSDSWVRGRAQAARGCCQTRGGTLWALTEAQPVHRAGVHRRAAQGGPRPARRTRPSKCSRHPIGSSGIAKCATETQGRKQCRRFTLFFSMHPVNAATAVAGKFGICAPEICAGRSCLHRGRGEDKLGRSVIFLPMGDVDQPMTADGVELHLIPGKVFCDGFGLSYKRILLAGK